MQNILFSPSFTKAIALASAGGDATDKRVATHKVLIVDDQQDLLDTAAQLFEFLGYDVLSANNGSDALEIIKRTPDINLLFTDVVMPGIDGVRLAEEAHKFVPDIKVILVSGFSAPYLAQNSPALSRFDFLSKPYRLGDISKILRKAGLF